MGHLCGAPLLDDAQVGMVEHHLVQAPGLAGALVTGTPGTHVGDPNAGVVREAADDPLAPCARETHGLFLPVDRAEDVEAKLSCHVLPMDAYGVGRRGVPQRPHGRAQELQDVPGVRDGADVMGAHAELVGVPVDAPEVVRDVPDPVSVIVGGIA